MESDLPEIILRIEIIDGKERIVVSPVDSPILEKLIRQLNGARYLCLGSWHLPCHREAYESIRNVLAGLYKVNIDLLREQLDAKRISVPVQTAISLPIVLCPENIKALDLLIKTLQVKAYSEATIKV